MHTSRQTDRDIEKERSQSVSQPAGHTDRQPDGHRHTARHTYRQTDRHRQRDRHTDGHRQRDRHTARRRQTDRHYGKVPEADVAVNFLSVEADTFGGVPNHDISRERPSHQAMLVLVTCYSTFDSDTHVPYVRRKQTVPLILSLIKENRGRGGKQTRQLGRQTHSQRARHIGRQIRRHRAGGGVGGWM